MTWFKVDDKLWGHPKWLSTPIRSRGLWVTAGSWCAYQEQDGNVPRHVLATLGATPRDASALVAAGLWDITDTGWQFHDWAEFQPDSASQKAKREAESQGGELGNHVRWHVKRRIRVDSCEFCQASGQSSGPDRVPDSPPNPPVPSRPVPIEEPLVGTADAAADEQTRDDVERICELMADRVQANTGKRPNIVKAWRDAARLLIDRDGHTEAQILWLIDWATKDEFWRANILSLPKFREKFEQLRLKAMAGRPAGTSPGAPARPVIRDQWTTR